MNKITEDFIGKRENKKWFRGGYAKEWRIRGGRKNEDRVIEIVSKDGKLFYVADVPGNNGEVWFEFAPVIPPLMMTARS